MKRVTVFWFTVAFGLLVFPIVAIGAEAAKGTPFASAVKQWITHLFEPGYNEFLLLEQFFKTDHHRHPLCGLKPIESGITGSIYGPKAAIGGNAWHLVPLLQIARMKRSTGSV